MALHKMWDRHLVTNQGAVMTSGHSLYLGKGQLGIFDISPENQTKNGNPAVSDFSNQPKDRKFEIKLGIHDALSRSRHNKSKATIPFRVSDVRSVSVSAPKEKENITDEVLVGFDGRDGTEFSFNSGETTELSLTLSGEGIGYLGYYDADVTLKAYFEAGETVNNEAIVMDVIEQLKAKTLLGDVPVTDYVEITPVKDTAEDPVTGDAYEFFELTVQDLGDSSALGLVQAQYPDYVVRRTDRTGLNSTYTILAPEGTSLDDYEQGIASIIKGCEDCPAGFTEEGGGVIYNVTLEDDGADSTVVVQGDGVDNDGIPGAKTDTAEKVGQDNGVGIYVVATDDELTQTEIDTFVTANPTATISKVGETEAICTNGTVSTTSWASTETCTAKTETYTITLKDTKCGDSRLAELQAAYPDLTITEVADSDVACQRTYQTTVATNVVCEECSPMFRDTFMSEAPHPYDFVDWEGEEVSYDADAKMGIRIKGKQTEFGANGEALRYEIPFVNNSVHISVAGGYPTNVNENFEGYEAGRFNVKVISRAENKSNLGGDLMDYALRSEYYFKGDTIYQDNLYARTVLGQESDLDEFTQYVDYVVEISRTKFAQGFNNTQSETFDYHILAPVGKHQEVENLINSLAGAANVEVVRAYGE